MPRTLPEQPKGVPTARAVEILDELLANRPGWESTDQGWQHKKAGLHVRCANHPTINPFIVTRTGSSSEVRFASLGLETMLSAAGA